LLLSGLLGLACSVVFFILMFPIRNFYLGSLFLGRGWVPFVLVFFMSWALVILVLKYRKLAKQRESMLLDLLPLELGEDITEENLDRFADHIKNLPVTPGSSFLVNRVARGLEHFRARRSNPEVANMLSSQSEIDATSVESSYAILKVFIWAIPILGFIGTVIGISAAVGGFSGSLDQAQDISVLKESLNGVTGGLATAFDTTLVALVMSMLVMFPASSMQKSEEDLLNSIDEYCNENLLKRLNDGGVSEMSSGGVSQATIQRAVNAAMAAHQAELEAWRLKLDAIGATLTGQIVEGWREVNGQLKLDREEKQTSITSLHRMADEFQHTLTDLSLQTETIQDRMTGSMAESAQSVQAYVVTLQEGLHGLNQVLSELGGKQIVIQSDSTSRRRGWLFGRKNGEP
jgi:biopolymer transport protein ExbB/TolQ